MAHDVNPSGTDVAAQVRSAFVSKTSSDRLELWMPESTRWMFNDGVLTLTFDSEFRSSYARSNLEAELVECLREVCGATAKVAFEAAAESPAPPMVEENEMAQAGKQLPQSLAGTRGEVCPPIGTPSRGSRQLASDARREVSEGAACERLSMRVDGGHVAPSSIRLSGSSQGDVLADPNFVTGACNELACSTVNMVADHPGKYSPAFLYGPSGSGKTLLAAAIAQRLRVQRRLPRVIYMTSEQFLNEFTEGLRGGGLPMFRRKYRDVEALILEDIQFFLNKRNSLGEVKHTLDNLLLRKKQVVFTSDRPASELGGLGAEMQARINGGLVAPLMPLDRQTREEILRRKCTGAGIELDASVMSGVADRVAGDGRLLNGIVNRLVAVAETNPSRLRGQDCWAAIGDLIQATQAVVRLSDIERTICDVFGLEADSLQSSSKTRRVSQPRMLAMFLARKHTPSAYKEIGSYFGKRRHSTVISAQKTVETWLTDNAELELGRGLSVREAIRQVESRLQVG